MLEGKKAVKIFSDNKLFSGSWELMSLLTTFFCPVVMNFYAVYFRCKGCLPHRMRRRAWIWAPCVRHTSSPSRIWLTVATPPVSSVAAVTTESPSPRNTPVYPKRSLHSYTYQNLILLIIWMLTGCFFFIPLTLISHACTFTIKHIHTQVSDDLGRNKYKWCFSV